MSLDMIVYCCVGLALLYLVIKLLKLPIKLLINGIIGAVMLFITNYIGAYFGFTLPINAVTSLIAGFLGVPGIIFLIILQFL